MVDAVLSNPDVFPSDDILSSHLGKTTTLYTTLLADLKTKYPGLEEDWRYYNDGKRWLMPVRHKKKTLFWLSVSDGFFRTTFYIGGKHEALVRKSSIPAELKEEYAAEKGKIRGIRLVIKAKRNLATFHELLDIKLKTR